MTNVKDPLTPAMSALVEGYQYFKQKHFEESASFKALVEYGQKPSVLIVACCDSRVDPAIITGCNPGDLFVVRNVANLVPPFEGDAYHHGTSAALEFGVTGLGVSDIILLGHSYCGGIRALMEKSEKEAASNNFIDTWMDIAKPAKDYVLQHYSQVPLEDQVNACEKKSLLISLDNLNTFPWIQERILAKTLHLHAWYFDLNTGLIEAYQPEIQQFIPLDEFI